MRDEERVDYEHWISELKVGDEVAIYSSGWGGSWSILKITKITPTGRLNLNDGSVVVNNDGTIRGDNFNKIKPVTDDIREKIFIRKMRGYVLRNFNVYDLECDELHKVYRILKRKNKAKEKESVGDGE
jgi:hypothetical protein